MMRWQVLSAVLLVVGLAGVSGMAEATPAVEAAAEVARARAASPVPLAVDESRVIATVGEVTITERELQQAAARQIPSSGSQLSSEERQEVLDALITDRQLFLQARALNYEMTPKVQKVMVNALLQEQIYRQVRSSDFSESDLRAYYEEHKSDFVVPEKREVYSIFIKVGDERSRRQARRLAKDLQQQVAVDPSGIKHLATQHSEDAYSRRGGSLGYVSMGGKPGIPVEVIETAFELEPNEVSDAFFAGGGFYIVMVKSVRPRVERTFDQMKGAVLRKLKNEVYQAAYDAYAEAISAQFPVEVDLEALEAADLTPRHMRESKGTEEPPQVGDALQK